MWKYEIEYNISFTDNPVLEKNQGLAGEKVGVYYTYNNFFDRIDKTEDLKKIFKTDYIFDNEKFNVSCRVILKDHPGDLEDKLMSYSNFIVENKVKRSEDSVERIAINSDISKEIEIIESQSLIYN